MQATAAAAAAAPPKTEWTAKGISSPASCNQTGAGTLRVQTAKDAFAVDTGNDGLEGEPAAGMAGAPLGTSHGSDMADKSSRKRSITQATCMTAFPNNPE